MTNERPSLERLIKLFREEFYASIERKTGWGKEELKLEFERSLSNATTTAMTEFIEDGK